MCIKGSSYGRNQSRNNIARAVAFKSAARAKKASNASFRRVVSYSRGRLETILVPMIMGGIIKSEPTTTPKKNKQTLLIAKSFEPGRAHIKQEEGFNVNSSSTALVKSEIGDDHADRVVKKELIEEEDEIKTVDLNGIGVFVKVLLHALDCRSCSEVSCQKMRLVLGHFLACQRPSRTTNCTVCKQLVAIVEQHSRYMCPMEHGGCPVPMCDVIKETPSMFTA